MLPVTPYFRDNQQVHKYDLTSLADEKSMDKLQLIKKFTDFDKMKTNVFCIQFR